MHYIGLVAVGTTVAWFNCRTLDDIYRPAGAGAVGGAGGYRQPHILADKLHCFNQGADYIHSITTYSPGFSDLHTALYLTNCKLICN